MKITENLLLNQIRESEDEKKEKEEESVLVTITDSLFFKIAKEVVNFIKKILTLISEFIKVFF